MVLLSGKLMLRFQHTAARRRLVSAKRAVFRFYMVSTHSRPKAAGFIPTSEEIRKLKVSTHSRPKAAGPID